MGFLVLSLSCHLVFVVYFSPVVLMGCYVLSHGADECDR